VPPRPSRMGHPPVRPAAQTRRQGVMSAYWRAVRHGTPLAHITTPDDSDARLLAPPKPRQIAPPMRPGNRRLPLKRVYRAIDRDPGRDVLTVFRRHERVPHTATATRQRLVAPASHRLAFGGTRVNSPGPSTFSDPPEMSAASSQSGISSPGWIVTGSPCSGLTA